MMKEVVEHVDPLFVAYHLADSMNMGSRKHIEQLEFVLDKLQHGLKENNVMDNVEDLIKGIHAFYL